MDISYWSRGRYKLADSQHCRHWLGHAALTVQDVRHRKEEYMAAIAPAFLPIWWEAANLNHEATCEDGNWMREIGTLCTAFQLFLNLLVNLGYQIQYSGALCVISEFNQSTSS